MSFSHVQALYSTSQQPCKIKFNFSRNLDTTNRIKEIVWFGPSYFSSQRKQVSLFIHQPFSCPSNSDG